MTQTKAPHWTETVIGNWENGILGEMRDNFEEENVGARTEGGVTSREVAARQRDKEKIAAAHDAKNRKRLFDRLRDLFSSRSNLLRARDSRRSARDVRCYATDAGGLDLEAFYRAEMARRTKSARIVGGNRDE